MAYIQQDYTMPMYGTETEEERKRKEQAAADAQPVKHTVETNPVTGEQTMKIEGNVKDLTADNPYTPTVTAPIAPESIQPQTNNFLTQASQVAQAIPQVSQPAPGTQIAGAMQMPQQMPQQMPVQPVAPIQQAQGLGPEYAQYETQQPVAKMQQPVAQMQPPAAEPQPGSAAYMNQEAATPVSDHATQILSHANNPQGLLGMASDPNVPKDFQVLARKKAAESLNNQLGVEKAQAQIASMSENDLAKALREKSTGGSWLKAIAFGMLGMTQSAQDEAAKLGIGKEQTILGADNKPYIVKMAANGTPLEGFNAETGKKLDAKELVGIVSQASLQKGTVTHTGKMQDITTGDIYYEQTTPQGIKLVSPSGKLYSGSSSNLRAYGIGSDIGTKNQIQLNELQNKLAYAGPTERAKIVAENEAKFGPLDPNTRAQALGQVTGTVPTQAQAQPQAAAPTQAPVQPQAFTAPSQATMPAGMPSASPLPSGFKMPAIAAGAPTINAPVAPTAYMPGGNTIAGREQAQAINKRQLEENIQVGGKRTESFNKILDEEVRPQAQAGDVVSNVRKQQFAIFDRPGVDANKLFGLYNAAAEDPTNQKLAIIRDVFGGIYKPETEVSNRLAQLDLSPQEKSALQEYNIANQRINAATLKQTAGPGSVSDAEQKANRESNVDPTKIPALGAYNAMAQSQFNGDQARYKADWADKQPATNALQLDKAWRKEQAALNQMYGEIAKQRAEFISKNGATTNAVREGYKKYPIPEYDPVSESWKKTKPLATIFGK
jgi:hypothetical protein